MHINKSWIFLCQNLTIRITCRLDIVAFSYAEGGAMGCGGEIIIVSSKKNGKQLSSVSFSYFQLIINNIQTDSCGIEVSVPVSFVKAKALRYIGRTGTADK